MKRRVQRQEEDSNIPEGGERIQKVLARGGVGSRREVEGWITEGKVRVNDNEAHLGQRLQAGDKLQVNGRIVRWEKYSVQPTQVLIITNL